MIRHSARILVGRSVLESRCPISAFHNYLDVEGPLGGEDDHGHRLREEWATWLTQTCKNWDCFITITFRSPRMPHNAISTLNGIEKLLRSVGAVRGFIGTELHVSRMLHIHGITAHRTSDSLQRTLLWRTLYKRYGRSQVSPIRSAEDVAKYVTKYCTKDLTEYSIW